MLAELWLVARKDLQIERRSKVGMSQVIPFGLLVLILFAFAFDANQRILEQATPGLYWIAVFFSAVLLIQRNFSTEATDSLFDALRMSGLSPAGIFLGKVVALVIELAALQVILGLGVAVLYHVAAMDSLLLVATVIVTTLSVASSGSIYGALVARIQSGNTLLPLLLLPLLSPVLIGATRSFEISFGGGHGSGWPWVALISIFALMYLVVGAVLFQPLMEDS